MNEGRHNLISQLPNVLFLNPFYTMQPEYSCKNTNNTKYPSYLKSISGSHQIMCKPKEICQDICDLVHACSSDIHLFEVFWKHHAFLCVSLKPSSSRNSSSTSKRQLTYHLLQAASPDCHRLLSSFQSAVLYEFSRRLVIAYLLYLSKPLLWVSIKFCTDIYSSLLSHAYHRAWNPEGIQWITEEWIKYIDSIIPRRPMCPHS